MGLLLFDRIDEHQPRLADCLPFLPQQIGIDLLRVEAGAVPLGAEGDQALDVLAEAGTPGIEARRPAQQHAVIAAQLRVRQQAGLQDLRLGHVPFGAAGQQVRIVLQD